MNASAHQALFIALDLARMPGLAENARHHPLPPDVLTLIKIAAGDPEAVAAAAEASGKDAETVRTACVFYLEQILFAPQSDSYRTLGVGPSASRAEMREHLKWLMRWLHPDHNQDDWEAIFTERVLAAWQDVKAPDGRERYDRERSQALVVAEPPRHKSRRRRSRSRGRSSPRPVWIGTPVRKTRRRIVGRVVAVVFAGMAGLAAMLLLPSCSIPWSWVGACDSAVDRQLSSPLGWHIEPDANEQS